MILTGFTLSLAMLGSIFLRAMQQRNNIHNEWVWVWPCSQGMAWIDYMVGAYVMGSIWEHGLTLETGFYIFMAGNGAAIGCMGAMWIHNKKLNRSS